MKLCKYFKEIQTFLYFKATSSNITNIIVLSKTTLFSIPYPFQLKTRNQVKLTPCVSKWQWFFHILAFSTLFLHLNMILNWIRIHRSDNEYQSQLPYWQHIMMDYFFAIYLFVFIGLLHFTWVKDQAIFLLNSNIETEIACQKHGKVFVSHSWHRNSNFNI
jgi:hypothetical protein